MFILDKCFAASREDFKQDVFQGRAGVVHRYIKYNLKKKRGDQSRRPAPLAIPPFAIGSYLFIRGWVLPSPLGFTPSSLGPTLCHWVLPFVVGPYPLSLGPTLCRWVLPFIIGPYHSSLGPTIHSSLGPTIHPSLGPTIHYWALPFIIGPSSLCFTPFAIGFTPLVWFYPSLLGSTP